MLVVGARGHCPATLYSRRPLLPAPLICISHLLRRCGRQMAQAWDGFCAAFHPPCALLLQRDELEEGSRRALRCLRVASTSLVFCARDAWWASDMRLSVSVPRREGSLSPHASAPLSAGPRVRGESQPCVSPITLTGERYSVQQAGRRYAAASHQRGRSRRAHGKISARMRDALLMRCRHTQPINRRKTSMCLGRWRIAIVATLPSPERLSFVTPAT